jgi:peptide subunit release factor 1 (eRF1)
MVTMADLRRLAELSGPERAFVSMYLSGPEADRGLRPRCERIRSLLGSEPVELEHFDRSLEMIKQRVEETPVQGSRCLFACWANDFLEDYELPDAFESPDLLRIGSSPYLLPLAEMMDEFASFIAVVADNRRARIFTISSERADPEATVKGEVKNHVKVGGWSQQRYERRRDQQLLRYAKEVVEELQRLQQRRPFERLLMVGSEEALQEIRRQLPPDLEPKLGEAKAVDLGEGDSFVMEELKRLNEEEERREERAIGKTIRDEYLSGGRAAAGPEEVLLAAQQGRVQQAIVYRDASLHGSQCRSCEHLAPEALESCPVCGSAEMFPVDLLNKITALLVATGAELEFADELDGLAELGEIAALLRY